MLDQFLRFTDVQRAVGISRTTLWRWERKNLFPKRRQLGPNSVAWLKSEIETFIQSRSPVGRQS